MLWVPVDDELLWLQHGFNDVLVHGRGVPVIHGVAESFSACRAEQQRWADLAVGAGDSGNEVTDWATWSGEDIDNGFITRDQRNRFRCESEKR